MCSLQARHLRLQRRQLAGRRHRVLGARAGRRGAGAAIAHQLGLPAGVAAGGVGGGRGRAGGLSGGGGGRRGSFGALGGGLLVLGGLGGLGGRLVRRGRSLWRRGARGRGLIRRLGFRFWFKKEGRDRTLPAGRVFGWLLHGTRLAQRPTRRKTLHSAGIAREGGGGRGRSASAARRGVWSGAFCCWVSKARTTCCQQALFEEVLAVPTEAMDLGGPRLLVQSRLGRGLCRLPGQRRRWRSPEEFTSPSWGPSMLGDIVIMNAALRALTLEALSDTERRKRNTGTPTPRGAGA